MKKNLWVTNTEAGIPMVVAIATLGATRQPINTQPNAGKGALTDVILSVLLPKS